MNYNLHFTIDYEIHGNGDGDPMELMIEPTYRLMNQLAEYGQRLIIMADVAELLAFKRYREQTGDDHFHLAEIEDQLRSNLRMGGGIGLHIHSSYFRAEYNGVKWVQCAEEYNLAALPFERIDEMIGQCVTYLEEVLRPVQPDWKCRLFRAANWSMMPTENLYKALVKHGLTMDTSVYKGGIQGGQVCYDYTCAYDNLLSYPASAKDINLYDAQGEILEYPIYTEMRSFWAFLSLIRAYRMVRAKFHKHKLAMPTEPQKRAIQASVDKRDNRTVRLRSFFRLAPWKMDFNQATGRQLIRAMKRIMKRTITDRDKVDVILIGHSKTFIPYNMKTLRPFLKWAERQPAITQCE